MLTASGFTDVLMKPSEHTELPARARCGLTNLVERTTVKSTHLSRHELRAGVAPLVRKLTLHKPKFICFVGKVRLGVAG